MLGCSYQSITTYHAVNTRGGVVLDPQVNVLGDTETEGAGGGEGRGGELVLLHLEAGLEELHGLGPTDRHVRGDFLVTAGTETTDRVTGLAEARLLASELLEHLGGLEETAGRGEGRGGWKG